MTDVEPERPDYDRIRELERDCARPIEAVVHQAEGRAMLDDLVQEMADAGWADAERVVANKYAEVIDLQERSGLPTDPDTVIPALRRWLLPSPA